MEPSLLPPSRVHGTILIPVCFICDELQAESLEKMYFSQKAGKVSILACLMFRLPPSELVFPETALSAASLVAAWAGHGFSSDTA